MTEPLLSIAAVSKTFGDYAALRNVTLDVMPGEFIALLGPSGCGKTTLLRCIAGFLFPDSGTIRINGDDLTGLPPYRRPLNTVFQNYALFPHMSVADNVAYGPRRQGVARREALRQASEALDMVGLSGVGNRFPRQLSGGQQQRVALARAIVNRPKLLLLDEPLSALDLKLRKRVQIELKHLQEKLGIAFVFVTHDQDEAMTMADRIVVMNKGQIEQIGRGQDIYREPATLFVADFIGEANLLPCEERRDGKLACPVGDVVLQRGSVPADRTAIAVLRPEHITLSASRPASGVAVAATVEDVIHVGSHVTVNVRAAGDIRLSCRVSGSLPHHIVKGGQVFATFRPEDLYPVAD